MIYVRSGTEALAERQIVISPGTGIQHWGTTFFGPRTSTTLAPGPQATMSEMRAHETLKTHFHGVSMFQLFIAGFGTMGNRDQELKPLSIQFKDRHTTYGPVTAGPQGLSFVALRMYTGDSKPVFIHNKEEAKKKKFSAASKIPRVKKGKKEKNRIYKKPMQKEEKPVAIDPEVLARRKYLGEYEEEEAAAQNAAAKPASGAAH